MLKLTFPFSGKKSRDLCYVCARGFQFRRSPPLHMLCSACEKPIHIRCVQKADRKSRNFLCPKCRPAPANVASPPPTQSCVAAPPPPPPALTARPTSPIPPVRPENSPLKYCNAGPSATARRLLTFDSRMESLGFTRSPSQPNTIGDGACGVRALCDQLNQDGSESMFGPDDHEFLRRYTVMQAPQLVRQKVLDEEFFEPNVKKWCLTMSKNHEFIDNMFLLVFAQVLERDVIVIPVHRETNAGSLFSGNGDFRWIKGR